MMKPPENGRWPEKNYTKEGIAVERKGKASTRAKNKYNAANYDSLRIVIPKGRKQTVRAHADGKGVSIIGLVNTLLRNDIGMSEEEWKNPTEEQ